MVCQILRVATYKAGAINFIGREEYRQQYKHRNSDIDESRTHLNRTIGNQGKTLYQKWVHQLKQLGIKMPARKNQNVMEQMVITASPDFFKRLGWDCDKAKTWSNEDIPGEIKRYFNDSIRFVREYVGKENVISATVHFDEATPHVHIDYIPVISGKHKRKSVYEKDESGKCVRDENGSPVRARDEHGKILYEYVDEPPSINRTEFWAERGGRQSYRKLQDLFFEQVAEKYGLERGEVGSDREHEEQRKFKSKLLKKEIQEKKAEIVALDKLENQSIKDLSIALQKNPKILGQVNMAAKIALGDIMPVPDIKHDRERGR